jgi:hypothetical protein
VAEDFNQFLETTTNFPAAEGKYRKMIEKQVAPNPENKTNCSFF